jgi:UDP-N-acetyl-D-galactosamine dehydrogenase
VDPYYLAYKSNQLGYKPKVITSGREVNEYMPYFVAEKLMRLMLEKGIQIKGSNILILGATFKENTPDTRNSKVPAIKELLEKQGALVIVYDPLINSKDQSMNFYSYDVVFQVVEHGVFNFLDFKKCIKHNEKSIFLKLKEIL